jgi:hypothetical protein
MVPFGPKVPVFFMILYIKKYLLPDNETSHITICPGIVNSVLIPTSPAIITAPTLPHVKLGHFNYTILSSNGKIRLA